VGREIIIFIVAVAIGVALAVGVVGLLVPGDPYNAPGKGTGKLPDLDR
jgi:hypothetical protein